jgi:transcription elongation GreA/GreB family factor
VPSTLDKKLIVDQLIQRLELDLTALEEVAHSTKDYVIDGDIKSEGKYDTRAIEASYLAGAQEKRVEEIKLDIQMLKDLELHPTSNVQLGSIIRIRLNKDERFYFLSSTAGGSIVDVNGIPVLVISVFSPIGSEALNLSAGDSFEVETPAGTRLYEITAVS